MSLKCPHCGGVIVAFLGVSPDAFVAQNGASSGALRQDAQEILGSDLEPSPNGARAYNQGYPGDFEAWWKVYPMRKDKRKALKAWRNAVTRIGASTGATRQDALAQLMAAAMAYRNDPNRSDEYTKYPEGWLNGDRWLDDPLPARGVDPYTAEQDRLREAKHAEARRFVEEEHRVRGQG